MTWVRWGWMLGFSSSKTARAKREAIGHRTTWHPSGMDTRHPSMPYNSYVSKADGDTGFTYTENKGHLFIFDRETDKIIAPYVTWEEVVYKTACGRELGLTHAPAPNQKKIKICNLCTRSTHWYHLGAYFQDAPDDELRLFQ